MAILAAQSEGKARWVGEAAGRSVDHFGDECQGLQRARPQIFGEKKRSKIADLPFIARHENGAQPLQIDIFGADVVMAWHREMAEFGQSLLGFLARDGQERFLRGLGAAIHQVENYAFILTDDGRVRFTDEIANCGRVPVITAREFRACVHALLNNGPVSRISHDEGVQIELKSVSDGVVINFCREAAGPNQRIAIESFSIGECNEFAGRFAGLFAAPAANVNAEFVGARIQATFQRAKYGRGDAGGVPVHAHNRAQGLEPERITEACEEFGGAVMMDDTLDNGRAERLHTDGQPLRDLPAMKW